MLVIYYFQTVKLEFNKWKNAGRAELIAHEIDGDSSSNSQKTIYFENNIVDKVFLKSNRCLRDEANYAVAAYNGREIHLTGVKGNTNKVIDWLKVFGQMYSSLDPTFPTWTRVWGKRRTF